MLPRMPPPLADLTARSGRRSVRSSRRHTGPMHAGLVFRVGRIGRATGPARDHPAGRAPGGARAGPGRGAPEQPHRGRAHLLPRAGHARGRGRRVPDPGSARRLRHLPARADRRVNGTRCGPSAGPTRSAADVAARRPRLRPRRAIPSWVSPSSRADQLNAWVARYFTRENAVLWVAGGGDPRPGCGSICPAASDARRRCASVALPNTPASFTGGGPGDLAWDTVVRRGARAAVLANVLERRMTRDLRDTGRATDPDPVRAPRRRDRRG